MKPSLFRRLLTRLLMVAMVAFFFSKGSAAAAAFDCPEGGWEFVAQAVAPNGNRLTLCNGGDLEDDLFHWVLYSPSKIQLNSGMASATGCCLHQTSLTPTSDSKFIVSVWGPTSGALWWIYDAAGNLTTKDSRPSEFPKNVTATNDGKALVLTSLVGEPSGWAWNIYGTSGTLVASDQATFEGTYGVMTVTPTVSNRFVLELEDYTGTRWWIYGLSGALEASGTGPLPVGGETALVQNVQPAQNLSAKSPGLTTAAGLAALLFMSTAFLVVRRVFGKQAYWRSPPDKPR